MEHLTIVGAGRVGTSLALDLASLGRFREVHLVGRAATPPDALADDGTVRYRSVAPCGELPAPPLLPAADLPILLFCVPDDALPALAARWAGALEEAADGGPRLSLHTSGVHPASVLAPLRGLGARVGGWHPLLALPAPRARAFRSITFGVEGDDEAVSWAAERSSDLGARALRVRADAKPLYHAAAVFGSNYLVACLAVAEELLRRCTEGTVPPPAESGGAADDAEPGGASADAGVPARGDATALAALLPLARSALDNVARAGLAGGATGPIVRGDIETIRAHLHALDPATSALYRALGAALLRSRGSGASDDPRLAVVGDLLDVEG